MYSQVRFAGTVRWDPLMDDEWIKKLSGPVLYPDPEISNYYPPECAYFMLKETIFDIFTFSFMVIYIDFKVFNFTLMENKVEVDTDCQRK